MTDPNFAWDRVIEHGSQGCPHFIVRSVGSLISVRGDSSFKDKRSGFMVAFFFFPSKVSYFKVQSLFQCVWRNAGVTAVYSICNYMQIYGDLVSCYLASTGSKFESLRCSVLPLEGWLFLSSNIVLASLLSFSTSSLRLNYSFTPFIMGEGGSFSIGDSEFPFKALTLPLWFLGLHPDGAPEESSLRWACLCPSFYRRLNNLKQTLSQMPRPFTWLVLSLALALHHSLPDCISPVPFDFKNHCFFVQLPPRITTPAFPDSSAKFPEHPPLLLLFR